MINPLRTKKTFEKYKKFMAKEFSPGVCSLCEKAKSIKNFKYWKIVGNKFPYDLIAKTNHIIFPKRHVVYEELNKAEKRELDLIKSKYIQKKYEMLIEATKKRQSVPEHFHIHLIIFKD